MKYLWLAPVVTFSVACQDSGTDSGEKGGFVAGYRLTCGFPWEAGSRLVVEQEFARDYRDGAIACAREHPERARRMLGLANQTRTVVAGEAERRAGAANKDAEQTKPLAAEEHNQQAPPPSDTLLPVTAEVTAENAAVSGDSAQTPAKPGAGAVKANATARTGKAPAKTVKPPPTSAGTPASSTKAPAKAATAKVPARNEAPVTATRPATGAPGASTPERKVVVPSAKEGPGNESRSGKQVSDYERFMDDW